jgi:hypothetical protein
MCFAISSMWRAGGGTARRAGRYRNDTRRELLAETAQLFEPCLSDSFFPQIGEAMLRDAPDVAQTLTIRVK